MNHSQIQTLRFINLPIKFFSEVIQCLNYTPVWENVKDISLDHDYPRILDVKFAENEIFNWYKMLMNNPTICWHLEFAMGIQPAQQKSSKNRKYLTKILKYMQYMQTCGNFQLNLFSWPTQVRNLLIEQDYEITRTYPCFSSTDGYNFAPETNFGSNCTTHYISVHVPLW